MPKTDDKNLLNVSIGYTIMAAILLCTFIGYKIDQKLKKTSYPYTIAGLMLGMAYSGYEIWKLVKRSQDDTDKK